MPGSFFQKSEYEYNPESNLFSLLGAECINLHGIPMIYYVTTYNTEYDKIFGENPNRQIQRFFECQAMFKLQSENELWSRFGLEGLDNFSMFVSIKHFEQASKADQYGNPNVYPSYIPQEGDVIKSKFNDYYYTILTVKKTSNQFHRRQHFYELIVKPKKDENLQTSASIQGLAGIEDYELIADIFNTSAASEAEKPLVNFDASGETPSPDDRLQW